jgi:biopolymer transport protein ExbD
MAINRERRKRENVVPTDSLSDIGFLLIIFFILTTSIQRVTGFQTEIPSAQRAEQTQQTKLPSVKLNNGQLTLDDQPASPDQLRARLAALQLPTRPESERVVVVEATGSVNYQSYFETLSAISAAGGVVGLISEEKGGRR